METNAILQLLKQAVPESVLEKTRFGRTSQLCVWIEGKNLSRVAAFLKSQPEIALDWLENFSTAQMGEALVLTYFLRSFQNDNALILRVSQELGSQMKEVSLRSVSDVWPMAQPFEIEIQDLFGVMFQSEQHKNVYARSQLLPKEWNGYPLRKNYVFPVNFLGVRHSSVRDQGGSQ